MAKSVYELSAYIYLIAMTVGADIIRPLRPNLSRVKKFLKKVQKSS